MAERISTAGYTAKQVTSVTGVPYQTLNHWARTGLIEPSVARAAGRGTERIYSFRDLVTIKVAMELRSGGIATRALRKVIDFLHDSHDFETPSSSTRLVVTPDDIVLVRSNRELISVLKKPGQSYLAFVLDLPRTVVAVRKAAHCLRVA